MNDARSAEHGGHASVVDPKLRHVSFRRESMALVKKTQQLMQQQGAAAASSASAASAGGAGGAAGSGPAAVEGFFYASPDDASAVKPMFQVLWGPCHATFRYAQLCVMCDTLISWRHA